MRFAECDRFLRDIQPDLTERRGKNGTKSIAHGVLFRREDERRKR